MIAGSNRGEQILVVLPTHNEAGALGDVVRGVRESLSAADVLIVDDASTDGTRELADSLADEYENVHVLHRRAKDGLGRAYTAGFVWGLERGFEVLVECDADGSHQPAQLVRLLEALSPQQAGEQAPGGQQPVGREPVALVIGSRWMPGGSVRNWPWYRRAISRIGTRYAQLALDSRLRDITSGMRAFRADALREIDFASAAAHGYAFQVELAWRTERAGLPVAEVPIDFIERSGGRSKMSFAIVLEALWLVTLWGLKQRLGRR